MDRYSVPKVSIDGESHGDLLLIAIGSGATFAVIILIVLTSLIRHKKKPIERKAKDETSDNFTLAASSSDSGISNTSSQKSTLMYRYFGQSLSSFDVEKSCPKEKKLSGSPSGSIALNIDTHNRSQFYRENLFVISDSKGDRDDVNQIKSIQTIA